MSRRLPVTSPKARYLVNRLIARSEDVAFLGASHSEDHAIIERGFERAKRDLLAYLEELERRPPTAKSFTEPQS